MRINDNPFAALLDTLITWWCPTGVHLEEAPRSAAFPHRPTVYLLSSSSPGGAFVNYVGQTQDLRVRLAQHNANARMGAADWDTVFWLDPGIESQSLRLQLEAVLICAALPPLNKAIMLVRTKSGLAEIRFGQRGKLGRSIAEARRNG